MNLPDAITIVVAGPLLVAVADGDMGSNDMVVTLPFIGIDDSPSLSEGVDLLFQRLLVRVMNQP